MKLDIVKLARDAGLQLSINVETYPVLHNQIQKLVDNVLEEAAKMCDMMSWDGRSEVSLAKDDAASDCADAIRGMKS